MSSGHDWVLIIGYGNPLRGDDGAGPYAARELRRWGMNAIDVQQLTPELAEVISRVELVVFIDADAALAPGEVRVRDLECPGEEVFEHHVSPYSLMRLARDAYGHAPHAVLLSIGGESYELHEGVSEPVMRAIEEVVDICMNPV